MDKLHRQFHRLSTKFICGVIFILLLTLALSLAVNSQVVERYYLRQQIGYVRQAGEQLARDLESGLMPGEAVIKLEEAEDVLVAYSENTSDYDVLSGHLRDEFRRKGLGFQKFWLWDQDYQSAIQNGYRFRLYEQDRLNYGILVEYIPVGPNLYAIAAIVPNAADFVALINRFSIALYALSLAVAVLFICFLVRHITNPLRQMEAFARKISLREYGQLEVETGDELETVAHSMNQMSRDIQQYHQLLLDKNRQMEQLLDNVAHDLKTPISLIGMYAEGMRDELDDGTFLDTILRQNYRMAQMVESLLELSRVGQKDYPPEEVSLDLLLEQQIEEYRVFAEEQKLEICSNIVSDAVIGGNTELVNRLFSNLLSNAVKYAAGGEIGITLGQSGGRYHFCISNEAGNHRLDLNQIWEPFYVGEASRNKALSGTGLGLPMVKKIAERCGYSAECRLTDGRIQFEIIF